MLDQKPPVKQIVEEVAVDTVKRLSPGLHQSIINCIQMGAPLEWLVSAVKNCTAEGDSQEEMKNILEVVVRTMYKQHQQAEAARGRTL